MLEGIIFDNWNTLVQAPNLMKPGASVQIFLKTLIENGLEVDRNRFTEIYRPVAKTQLYESEKKGWTELDYIERLRIVLEKLDVEEPRRSILAMKAWESYMEEWPRQTSFYPETHSMLQVLKGRFKLGVLTNFMDGPTARMIFDNLGYERLFDSLVISAEEGYMKPSPVVYRKSLEELNLEPEKCVMVGDTYSTDIMGANNVGMRGILIDWEWSQGQYHGGCYKVIRNIAEFTQIIEDLM